MAKGNTLLAFICVFACISLLASATDERRQSRLTQAQQCRIQRLTASQPSQRIDNEGGSIEMWEQKDDMFQCAGVAAFRYTVKANGLSLPHYHPSPRLLFIEKGEGLISINFPGCPETFESESESMFMGRQSSDEKSEGREGRDSHQKVHRVRKGDIVAIPSGVAYWCFNDGTQDLVAVAVNDLNQNVNQLDQQFRSFYMAGGMPKQQRQTRFTAHEAEKKEYFENILEHFDTELMAEALEMPVELMRKIQQGEQSKKGFIVTVREGMRMIKPDEREQQNGLEESSWCSMKIRHNLESRQQSDVYSRQGGRLYVVNQNKLPLLRLLDMSAEKGEVFPNAMYSPSWNMNGHSVVYVTKGEAEVRIVDQSGQAIMNERVREGDMFVCPQFFVVTSQAGKEGFEWVAFKTTSSPMKSPLAGYTSVMRAMPLQVIVNSYQVSTSQAKDLKYNTGRQTMFLKPKA
ncbi:11S globulin seed storage protein 2-like [Impatiens glandulifera]|uniref:11S globulin seed storage protein 2-like n=1 Tax=Impatiens glandulifera TaxID=253017 RepID=UPI001FB11F0B|nr:11S globulin seed storage protein 2-like [Impatiens glandulifera]